MSRIPAPDTHSRAAWALRLANLVLIAFELALFGALVYGVARYPHGPFDRVMLLYALSALLLVTLIDILTLRGVARRLERWQEEHPR